jgi:rfaE bifunctional protein nucleotidyltransferase chain/domain
VGRFVSSEDALIAERFNWKRAGSLVVFVHGAFDLLHPGHVRLLEQARSLGNVLVVAVHGDTRDLSKNAAAVEGANARGSEYFRSLTPSAERAEIVAALAAVDYVTEMDPSGIAEFVGRFNPDVLAKGAESDKIGSSAEDLRAEKIVKEAGGTVSIIPLEPGYSRASLMERIRQAGA